MSAIACRYHLSAGGLLLTFLIFLVLVSGCTHAATSDGPAPTQSQAALPAPIAVCVLDGDGGAIQFGTASPERAGTYDPRAPIDPKTLNWVVTGIGCVN